MEFESTEKLQMVYETLKNIETAITRLQERTVQIHTADNFLLSPFGMEKIDATVKDWEATTGSVNVELSENN